LEHPDSVSPSPAPDSAVFFPWPFSPLQRQGAFWTFRERLADSGLAKYQEKAALLELARELKLSVSLFEPISQIPRC